MGDYESREQEARDIAQEAAEAGIPAAHWMLLPSNATDTADGAVCRRCDGDELIDVDQGEPPVAVRIPCPVCAGRWCPECVAGKHGNCDGVAYNGAIDQEVDCVCPDASHG